MNTILAGGSNLAGVEALVTQLSAARTADDIGDGLAAFIALLAFVRRPNQFPGFQDDLVEGGDAVLRGALERPIGMADGHAKFVRLEQLWGVSWHYGWRTPAKRPD